MEATDLLPLNQFSNENALESVRSILQSSKNNRGESQSQLQSQLQQKNKLTNHKVMIPITTKAFFEGKLQPSIRQNNIDRTKDEEQVIVNIGNGYLADMTINEATSFIDRRLKALRLLVVKDKESNTKVDKSKSNKKLTMKKGFLNQKKPKSAMKKSTIGATNQSKSTSASASASTSTSTSVSVGTRNMSSFSLPYMEIREEYDDQGNEIKSEAMNMSKVLNHVKNEIKSKHGNEETNNEMLNALLAANIDEDDQMNGDDNDNDDDDDHNDVDDDDVNKIEEVPKERPYQEITDRFDELMRLEEEAEMKKKGNIKSSKKLQGLGWAKGFLSSKKTSSRTKTSANSMANITTASASTQAKRADASSDYASASEASSRARKVQFHPSNEVKEIPRIGTRSIQSFKTPPQSTVVGELSSSLEDFSMSNTRTIQNIPSSSSRGPSILSKPTTSLEYNTIQNQTIQNPPSKSVSIGGVMERPGLKNNMHKKAENDGSNAEPKKLSRFAQRRQEQEQGYL